MAQNANNARFLRQQTTPSPSPRSPAKIYNRRSSTVADESLASSGYQTDQQRKVPAPSNAVAKMRGPQSLATTTVDATAIQIDAVSVSGSTTSSLQIHPPPEYQYYNHRVDWRRYESGVNMSMVLHDPKHANRQQNFFTKHWGEQFVPLPLDRFTSSTSLAKSKHLLRLYTTAGSITRDHFNTYIDELRRRDKRVKRQQHMQRQMMSSSMSMYENDAASVQHERIDSPMRKCATSASLHTHAGKAVKQPINIQNRLLQETRDLVTDDSDSASNSDVVFMRRRGSDGGGTVAGDEFSQIQQRHRRRLSVELEDIPKIFFDPGFALKFPQTFAQVIPWSLFTGVGVANTANFTIAVKNNADHRKHSDEAAAASNLSVRIHHDKLSHYMDLIEIQMAQHVAERAEGFFSAVMRHDVLRAGISTTASQISTTRTALAGANDAVMSLPERLQQAHIRRERCQQILHTATAINAVYQTQSTLQHLLTQTDYLAALEVLQTTREVLANDSLQLTRVHCFRHLEVQLSNMEAAVEQMCGAEFVKCLGSLWNQPVRVEELVELVFDETAGADTASAQRKRRGKSRTKSPPDDADSGDDVFGVSVQVVITGGGNKSDADESLNSGSVQNVFLALVSESELVSLDTCTFTSAFTALLRTKQTDFISAFRGEAIAALQASLKLIIFETLAACDHRTSSPLFGRAASTSPSPGVRSPLEVPSKLKAKSRPASAATQQYPRTSAAAPSNISNSRVATTNSSYALKIDVHQMYSTVNAMPFLDWLRLLERMCAASLCVLQRIQYTALLMQQCIEQHYAALKSSKIDEFLLPQSNADGSIAKNDSDEVHRTRLLLALSDECIAMFGSRVQDALVDIVHERLVILFPLFAASNNASNAGAGDGAAKHQQQQQQPSTKLALECFDHIWRILNTFCSYVERQKTARSSSSVLSAASSSCRTSILRAFMHDFGSTFLTHYFHAEMKLEKLELLLQNESWEPAQSLPAEYQRFFTALENERDKIIHRLNSGSDAETLVPIEALLPDSSSTLKLNAGARSALSATAEFNHNTGIVSFIKFGGIDYDELGGDSVLVLPGVAVLFVQMVVKYCHKAAQYRPLADEMLRLLLDLMKHFNSRLCQLILGAGAVLQPAARSQAVENGNSPTPNAPAANSNKKSNISSRDLALSWQCLQLLILLIPFIQAHFQYLLSSQPLVTTNGESAPSNTAHRNSKQRRALINRLNVLKGDLRDHQQRNMDKIVGVMRSLTTRSLSTWQVRAPTPSVAFQDICSKLQSLHANLAGLFGPPQLAELFDAIHVQFKTALRAALVQQQVRRDGGPKHSLVSQDLAYYVRIMRLLNSAFCDADMKDVWPL